MKKRLPSITLARVYGLVVPESTFRVLIDRLWPRGLAKEALRIDEWAKDLAPSTELRKWFGHRPERWEEFRTKYLQELASKDSGVRQLLAIAAQRPVVLLFAARDPVHNHANVLLEYLQSQR